MIAPAQILSRVKELPALSATALRLAELARDDRSGAADFERVRTDARQFPRTGAAERTAFGDVILHDHGTARVHVVEQALLIGAQIGAYVIGAHAGDNGVKSGEIGFGQIARREERDLTA